MTEQILENKVNIAIAKDIGIPTNDIQNVPAVPSLLSIWSHDFAQKAMVGVSVWAMTHGANQFFDNLSSKDINSLESSVLQIATGAAGFAVSCAWTIIVGYLRKIKMIQLINFIPNE